MMMPDKQNTPTLDIVLPKKEFFKRFLCKSIVNNPRRVSYILKVTVTSKMQCHGQEQRSLGSPVVPGPNANG